MTLSSVPTILLLTLLSAPAAPNEAWLWERYREGDLDTIAALLPALPRASAVMEFFGGVFEPDGEAARLHYDRVLTEHPGSNAEPWALERLWGYHVARGDQAAVTRYAGLLTDRHPEFKGLTTGAWRALPAAPAGTASPLPRSGVDIAPDYKATVWSVQVGAFKNRKGAEATGKRVARFGDVSYVDKSTDGALVTLVRVGRFDKKRDAERLAGQIKAATGLSGVVVAAGG